MATATASVAEYETQVTRFNPAHGLIAPTTNDLRSFLYDWFAQFEHRAHFMRQTWAIGVGDRLMIRKLVAAAGDTPLPIPD